jgi:hypothetical protein
MLASQVHSAVATKDNDLGEPPSSTQLKQSSTNTAPNRAISPSTQERMPGYRKAVDRVYGPVLRAFNLSPEVTTKLKELLVERFAGTQDAKDAAIASGLLTGGQMKQAMAIAAAESENEILQLVGPETAKQIQGMLAADLYLTSVSESYEPDFAAIGKPLNSSQVLQLAEALTASFVDNRAALVQTDPHYYPSVSSETLQLVTANPSTGLTPLDQQVVDKVASFLSPEQLAIVKAHLQSRTAYFTKRNSQQQ